MKSMTLFYLLFAVFVGISAGMWSVKSAYFTVFLMKLVSFLVYLYDALQISDTHKFMHLNGMYRLTLPDDYDSYCPDGAACDPDETCCKTDSRFYACCPLKNAVCCPDNKHCCPEAFRVSFQWIIFSVPLPEFIESVW